MIVNFAYNPTSWDDGPIPGGMADCLIRPILEHLPDDSFELTGRPAPWRVNTYWTFRHTYGLAVKPRGEIAVFISHGIADKGWRNNRKVREFDWVFVSGPAWTRRLIIDGYPANRIVEAGYSKLDPIFQGRVESPWEPDGRIKVVYAPTHGGGGEHAARTNIPPGTGPRRTSHWDRDSVLSLLPDDTFDVKVAPHPRHRPDKRSTLPEYVGADVVIADGGSTIYEAWALDIPVVFPSWLTAHANLAKSSSEPTFEGQIYSEHIGLHAFAPSDLPDLVHQAAGHGIGPREQAFIETILPRAYRGESGRMHAEALQGIAAGGRVPHVARCEVVTYEHVQSGRTRSIPAIDPSHLRYERSWKWRRVEEEPA